jgi:cation:H+ antiporter
VGNVVGSNIANILLILGISAMIAVVPGKTRPPEDRVWLLAATAGRWAICPQRHARRVEGAVLLVALALYIWRSLSRTPRPRRCR